MPICQEAQQIVDWQLHFENSELSRGIWGMTYQGAGTAQKSHTWVGLHQLGEPDGRTYSGMAAGPAGA